MSRIYRIDNNGVFCQLTQLTPLPPSINHQNKIDFSTHRDSNLNTNNVIYTKSVTIVNSQIVTTRDDLGIDHHYDHLNTNPDWVSEFPPSPKPNNSTTPRFVHLFPYCHPIQPIIKKRPFIRGQIIHDVITRSKSKLNKYNAEVINTVE
jgi:hypothetical protein